ncbi:YIP1 family protein [Niallia endozanthoxylica]|uniref:YIP1 family protein n=1 Tax=Niallia endozanthoxylica TaxID=2036016 RepID=A0A5J5HT99_9BACI|nr:YIP1 family protein [Niallia endozanthoxylica]KAA9025759.1 YIP1 family protein [Niallia endozanthoxylica]
MEKEAEGKIPGPKLLGMIWSPGEQFNKIRKNPRIWIPLLVVTVLNIAAYLIIAMSMTAEDLMLPGMTTQEAEMTLAIAKATTAVSGFAAPIFAILFSSLIHFIIVKIARKETSFKQLFSMNTYISFITGIGTLLNFAIMAAIGVSSTDGYITSLGGLFNNKSGILGAFELFSIWTMILTALGLHKVGQLSKTVSFVIVIIFFLITLAMATIGSLFSSLVGL